ncbi:MAG TPA: Hsp20/alpha crystallin family protein [Gemmatimonadota bacterium]|nr:Hsp20/alpha crystallin family protein [Gemmatimonadota bacterium]
MTTDTSDDSAQPGTDAGSSGSTGASESAESTGSAGASESAGRSTREMPFSDNIHGLVDDILEGVRNFTPVASVRYPRYDFVETPEAYLLVFDLPGVKRDDISVTTEGEDVVLSGERSRPEWGENAAVRRSERPYGGFRRALRMPADVRIDEIKARLDEGVLRVTLPRHTETSARKVDIEG